MKTFKSIYLKEDYISQNRGGKPLEPIGVVLHETATVGATARAEKTFFDSKYVGASAHVFVDYKEALQLIPFDEQAWHCMPAGNTRFIGVEMCNFTAKSLDKDTYDRTVKVIARIFRALKINKITKDNFMSHHEVSLKWKESTHTDPTAYLENLGINMKVARKDVQAEVDRLNKVFGAKK